MRADRVARFSDFVEPELNTGCWLWTGARYGAGYGQFWDGVTHRSAHRISWEIAKGDIPSGVGYHGTCVLHRCDTPACVNPAHLFLGTALQNNADRRVKGRSSGGALKGEANRSAKLTAPQVVEIRAALQMGASQSALARQYGVARAQVRGIASGRRWASVP